MSDINVTNEQYGEIIISDEVIATIASVATKEINGISGLSLSIESLQKRIFQMPLKFLPTKRILP